MQRRTLDPRTLSEQPSRTILATGAAVSLALGMAAFAMWGFAPGGYADDDFLWWTMAGFVLPLVAATGIALLGQARPEAAPAVAVATFMLAAAFVVALLN